MTDSSLPFCPDAAWLSGDASAPSSRSMPPVPAARDVEEGSAGRSRGASACADKRSWARKKARAIAKTLERPELKSEEPARLPIHEAADQWLGGGLRIDALHEFYAGERGDRVVASAFALLLAEAQARRESKKGGAVIWALDRRRAEARPYGPGLAELGVDPARVTLLPLPGPRDVLRAALDCVRERSVSVVLIELVGKQPLLDLTTTRRFQLAAQEAGTMVCLLRGQGEPSASAAATRWRVAAAPSRMLEAQAPGGPAFVVDLLKQRGGREGLSIMLEWDRDTASFRSLRDTAVRAHRGKQKQAGQGQAPLSGAFLAVATG